jgi:hypothetical protein
MIEIGKVNRCALARRMIGYCSHQEFLALHLPHAFIRA